MTNLKVQKTPSAIIIMVMTTITTVLWVFFGVYRILVSEVPPVVSDEILAPINPELDTKTLAKLGEKVYFERGETKPFPVEGVVIPDASPSAVIIEEEGMEVVATPSATPPEATISGDLL